MYIAIQNVPLSFHKPFVSGLFQAYLCVHLWCQNIHKDYVCIQQKRQERKKKDRDYFVFIFFFFSNKIFVPAIVYTLSTQIWIIKAISVHNFGIQLNKNYLTE